MLKTSLLIVALLSFSPNLWASHLWTQGKDTVVKLKGQGAEESASCKVFQVQMTDVIRFKIDCAGHERSASIKLKSSADQTVTQNQIHTTITKYGFLTKKPQVSRLKQSTLKVPFVEEIIHIKKNSNGELSFYFESFRVDEFGRIVQDGFIQAHSLTGKKLKVSAK